MIPNIHIHEQLLVQRYSALRHEMAQLRLITGHRRYRFNLARRMVARVGARLIVLGMILKQLEPSALLVE